MKALDSISQVYRRPRRVVSGGSPLSLGESRAHCPYVVTRSKKHNNVPGSKQLGSERREEGRAAEYGHDTHRRGQVEMADCTSHDRCPGHNLNPFNRGASKKQITFERQQVLGKRFALELAGKVIDVCQLLFDLTGPAGLFVELNLEIFQVKLTRGLIILLRMQLAHQAPEVLVDRMDPVGERGCLPVQFHDLGLAIDPFRNGQGGLADSVERERKLIADALEEFCGHG